MDIVDNKGTCQKCKKDAQNEFMECWLCKNRYHVIECEGDNMVQPSFLKSQWPTITRKWSCITFTCHGCREDANTKESQIMSQRLRQVEEMALDTSKKLNDITELLTAKKIDNVPADCSKSYAGVASMV